MALSILGIGLLVGLLVFGVVLAVAAWWMGVTGNSGLAAFFLVLGILGVIGFAIAIGFLGS
jgi:hypothetical protein